MLHIIVQSINPITRVGVPNFKLRIQNAKLSNITSNVKDMVDGMRSNCLHIIERNHTHPDYTIHLFTAMLTSRNDDFH